MNECKSFNALYAHSKGSFLKIRNRMKICQFIYSFIILIFLSNKIELGNKKLQKSFVEIFGEGWEEKTTEDEKWEDAEKDPDGFDQPLTRVPNADQQKRNFVCNDQLIVGHGNGDHSDGDRRKREIIIKFRAIKEIMKQKGIKFQGKERSKIDRLIAKKLGTNLKKIFEWVKEFGMEIRIDGSKRNEFAKKFIEMINEYKHKGKHSRKEWQQKYAEISEKLGFSHKTLLKWKKEMVMGSKKILDDYQEKRETIRKFNLIKEKIKQIGIKYQSKEWRKFENIIAKKLGTNRYKIYKWKKELGMGVKSKHSDLKKCEIIKEFDAMTNEYKQKGKHSHREWKQKYDQISKTIGVNWRTIQRWRKEFVMGVERKRYTNEERSEIMKQYWEMKQMDAEIGDKKIAKILKIGVTNISRWKGQFEQEET